MKIHCQGDDLFDVRELDGSCFFEDDCFVLLSVDKPYLKFRRAMTIGQFAEEHNLGMPCWELGGVDHLDNVDDARHARDLVKDDSVASDGR